MARRSSSSGEGAAGSGTVSSWAGGSSTGPPESSAWAWYWLHKVPSFFSSWETFRGDSPGAWRTASASRATSPGEKVRWER